MPWQVKLLQRPKVDIYRSDYFPRRFHYKKDANELKAEVEKNGGKAEVVKDK